MKILDTPEKIKEAVLDVEALGARHGEVVLAHKMEVDLLVEVIRPYRG